MQHYNSRNISENKFTIDSISFIFLQRDSTFFNVAIALRSLNNAALISFCKIQDM